MNRKIKSAIQYLIFLGGGLFLVWWQLKGMTPEEKSSFYFSLGQANYWVVIPIVFISLVSHLSRSMRWKLLMEPMEYNPALKNVFAATMVGYLANSAIPRLGEIVKCSALAKYEKLRVDKLVGTILIERLFDFVCYLFFIAITILIQIDVAGGFVLKLLRPNPGSDPSESFLKPAIAIAGLLILYIIIRKVFQKYPDNPVLARLRYFLKGLMEGIQTIRGLRRQKAFLGHTLLIWFCYFLQIYLGFLAMPETSVLGVKASFSVLTLATLAMIITPGGIGSFPVFVMQTLILYGISAPVGTAFGWLMWGVSTFIIIVAGLIALLALPLMNKPVKENSGQRAPGD